MARDLITLSGVALGFGGAPLFADVDLTVREGDRLCLVGRNGSGKSSLLKLMAGLHEPDAGRVQRRAGARVGLVAQDFDAHDTATVGDYVAGGLGADQDQHRVAAALEPLGLAADRALTDLSGGEARRVSLARALVGDPDLLLLDEPTNHLDIDAIEALERMLAGYRGAVVLISHDRALLEKASGRTAWLDRGRLRVRDEGFACFDRWMAEVLAAETAEAERLDQHLKAELRWLHRGVTARRRRNQGRLRALQDLRVRRAALGGRAEMSRPDLDGAARGGDIVIEAENIAFGFGDRPIVRGLSLRVMRGDRVALIGPNGAGKTTLIRLLTGSLAPDRGSVRLGQGIQMIVFDQHREALDPALTPWQVLCPQGGDRIDVRGRSRHVVGYLRDFLFAEAQARMPIAHLSGGERARLQLARLLARPANLLVLDEPTNDLDMETLDVLEDILGDYDGTILMVSHDRAFIDRLATSTLAFAGGGRITEYVGGYGDYLRQKQDAAPASRATKPKRAERAPRSAPQRLSYKEVRELDQLPGRIDELATSVRDLEERLAETDFYTRDRAGFDRATADLAESARLLAEAEARWLELEEKRERVNGAAP